MTTQRNAMFDVLKGLGIISVILSHTYRGGTDPFAVFVRELAMWCVPMFFMVQGYFMRKPQNYWQVSWNKIKQTYVPYLYWAVAYGIFYWLTIGKSFTLLDILYGKTALHLYYMFYYIIFALFVPLLYYLPRKVRIGTLYLMIFSNFAVTLILEISKTYHVNILHWSGPNPVKWWGFLALGMLIAEYPQIKVYITQHAKPFLAGFIALFAIGLIEPYLNNTLGYLFNKAALFPMSIGLTFALAIYYSTEKPFGEKFLSYVGSRTLGIYLGHFFLVDPLRNTLLPGDRFLAAIIVLFTCLAVKEIKDRVLLKLRQRKTPSPA
ncbi:MAG TPA: acyltransferase [Syntrophomonadaceae bacterium]|nr:acyltransferase [Syntrophomonadaceae bacterium]HPR94040.1 acyltransferase [Syntrophomonadaceae bacterium]